MFVRWAIRFACCYFFLLWCWDSIPAGLFWQKFWITASPPEVTEKIKPLAPSAMRPEPYGDLIPVSRRYRDLKLALLTPSHELPQQQVKPPEVAFPWGIEKNGPDDESGPKSGWRFNDGPYG